MGIMGPKIRSFFALELKKMLNLTLYTLASTNINQSALNLVEMCVTVRSLMSHTMDLIRTEHLRVICP